MKQLSIVLAFCSLLAVGPAAAREDLGELRCVSYGTCRDAGGLAYEREDYAAAVLLFEQQAVYAEQIRDLKLMTIAYNNAAIASLRASHCANAQDWLLIAQGVGPNDARTLQNAKLITAGCEK
jgi:hypothetical protein